MEMASFNVAHCHSFTEVHRHNENINYHIPFNLSPNLFCRKKSTRFNLWAIQSTRRPSTRTRVSVIVGVKNESSSSSAAAAMEPMQHPSARPLRIFISTGDVMGDMHGAYLTEEILKQAELDGSNIVVYALGGHQMKAAGAVLIGDNSGLSSIGFFEALPFVFPSLYLQMVVRRFLQKHPPDIVVLIDYPGVNIPFGKYIKQHFYCKVIYYIPPNEWMWTTARTNTTVKMSDLILSVYESESLYYKNAGATVVNIGHPLVDNFFQMSHKEARAKLGVEEDEFVVALIPASREQEVRHVWPLIASAAKYLVDICETHRRSIRFFVPVKLRNQVKAFNVLLEKYGLLKHVQLWLEDSCIVMAAADIAIAKSGSVNVELALHNVPQVVVYRIDGISAWISRNMFSFSVKFVSLVNVILGYQLVPEFIQEKASSEKIAEEAMKLLPLPGSDNLERKKVLDGYEELRQLLGKPGVVTRAAKLVIRTLYSSKKVM